MAKKLWANIGVVKTYDFMGVARYRCTVLLYHRERDAINRVNSVCDIAWKIWYKRRYDAKQAGERMCAALGASVEWRSGG